MRVKKLEIADNVHKYHKSIELVAFAPGSGWLTVIAGTEHNIAPTIRFHEVTAKNIIDFNVFTDSIDMPVYLIFKDETLYIKAQSVGIWPSSSPLESTLKGFYHPKPLPKMRIHKSSSGRIYLVKDDEKICTCGNSFGGEHTRDCPCF